MERQQVRRIHYSLRMSIVIICVQLCYWGASSLVKKPFDFFLAGLLVLMAIGIERLWALLAWMGPIVGTVDKKLQARILQETLERELARTQRYGSTSTVIAMSQKRRISLHIVAHHLRTSDAVFRGENDYIFAILPETTADQAHIAIERIIVALPIAHAIYIDSNGLRDLAKTVSEETSFARSPQKLAQLCLQKLTHELTRVAADPHIAHKKFPIRDLADRYAAQKKTEPEQRHIPSDYSCEKPVALTK